MLSMSTRVCSLLANALRKIRTTKLQKVAPAGYLACRSPDCAGGLVSPGVAHTWSLLRKQLRGLIVPVQVVEWGALAQRSAGLQHPGRPGKLIRAPGLGVGCVSARSRYGAVRR